jgi:SAM-dependent methyltransferase
MTAPGPDAATAYLESRFRPDPRRERVWRHIVGYLGHWWGPEDTVVDVGAGYCSFINCVTARRRIAVDVHPLLAQYAAAGVECVLASAIDLTGLEAESADVVFASNLLEHLSRDDIFRALREFRRVLKAGGRLILVQPNYRLAPAEYWDDYTHVTPLSDRSLADILKVAEFDLLDVQPRFLPFTLKSRLSAGAVLTPVYLRLPYRPFAGQMLLVATTARSFPP